MRLILPLLLIFAVAAAAKDKPESKPEFTAEQRIELLKLERDVLSAQIQAMPYDLAAKMAANALQVRHDAILKQLGVDVAKWRDDLATLEFSEVPVPVSAAKPQEKK